MSDIVTFTRYASEGDLSEEATSEAILATMGLVPERSAILTYEQAVASSLLVEEMAEPDPVIATEAY